MATTKFPLPNTAYALLPLTSPDIPQIAGFLCTSKLQLTVNRLLYYNWPAQDVQRAHYTPNVEGAIASRASAPGGVESAAGTEGWKVVSIDDENIVVGHLFLTRASGIDEEGKGGARGAEDSEQTKSDSLPNEVPKGLVPEVYGMVMRTVQDLNTQSTLHGSEQIQLTHVWVEPAHRHRGIGSALVQFSKNKCKEAGDLPFYVQSEPQLQPFLVEPKNNFGFIEDRHADMELAQFAPAYTGFGTFRLFGLRWDPKVTL